MVGTVQQDAMRLNDGTTIPRIGLGVFRMSPAEAETAVREAYGLGYRLFDTAARYGNEEAVGRALAAVDTARESLVTTKLPSEMQGYDSTLRAFDESARLLGRDVVDLYLIHWPSPGRGLYVDTWRALVKLKDEGRVRSIGVSNFLPEHLDRIADATGVLPAVNQIELHPFLQQRELRAYHHKYGIATEAWAPLGAGNGVLEHPVIVEVARELSLTPAQAVLAWHLTIDDVVIPKSTHPERMRENLRTLELVGLAEAAMDVFDSLDVGTRFGPDPRELY
ncbi:aldo/keto reductase [Gryllotalpicola ginsengisoli]|uniref:aldo/keto reductase n=1 Tax=Gryllotalpicola ginsengisoli TaxID=444608 RepID=UPI0003B49D14|nr:aldo/keto reductase [Gryllotalpicola ginsengisoli]